MQCEWTESLRRRSSRYVRCVGIILVFVAVGGLLEVDFASTLVGFLEHHRPAFDLVALLYLLVVVCLLTSNAHALVRRCFQYLDTQREGLKHITKLLKSDLDKVEYIMNENNSKTVDMEF